MNAATPTAVIIKQEFEKVRDYNLDAMNLTYEEYLDGLDEDDKNTTYLLGPDSAEFTMLSLNYMRYNKDSSQYNPNQFFDLEEEGFNYDFIAKFPYIVRLDFANIYSQSDLIDTFISSSDLSEIVSKCEIELHERDFKQIMHTQSKIEILSYQEIVSRIDSGMIDLSKSDCYCEDCYCENCLYVECTGCGEWVIKYEVCEHGIDGKCNCDCECELCK